MPKTIAILQSNYIPWKGYFDLINSVDEFIIYDEMQYTKRDWRNRNKIKVANGTQWLSIPVDVKGKYHQTIFDTEISDRKWSHKHWNTIKHCYSRAPYFKDYSENFEYLYLHELHQKKRLSEVNYQLIQHINNILDIKTPIKWSHDYASSLGKNQKLLSLCQAANASCYLSGPAAKDYLDIKLFNESGLTVNWMDYSSYPEYPQLHPPFEHAVSILDLLFCVGPNAANSMNSFK